MSLSEHFEQSEFEPDGPMPAECVPAFVVLCAVLETIRSQFNLPITVTSGYRSPAANAAAHGVPNSEHVASADTCAGDWYIVGQDMRAVFDWIRLSSGLRWGQVILEHGTHNDIIHLSVNPRLQRDALEGATANKTGYQRWAVSPLES